MKVAHRLNTRLNRRTTQYNTQRLSGTRPPRSRGLSKALRAFACAIRAHKRLIKLAPRIYYPVVVRYETKQREEDEKWEQRWEPILRKVYGDEAADKNARPAAQSDSRMPKYPRTIAVVKRTQAELDLWLKIGDVAMETYRQRYPHHRPSFTLLARLIDTASTLGRLACGMPLDGKPPKPEPEISTHVDFEEALERIYGSPE